MTAQRTVLVTGGTRGIGRALVEALQGTYDVRYTGVANVSGAAYPLDLSDPESIRALRRRLADEGVRLYGLVNNAAICETAHLHHRDFCGVLDRVLAANLSGPALLVHELLPLIDRPARIVNVSSQLGRIGRAGYSAYCASKFGLIGLTEVWSRELAQEGVTVNAVCPGWIQTDMTDQDLERRAKDAGQDVDGFRGRLIQTLDQRRFNTPQEIAHIIRFLLSDEASGITGRIVETGGPSC